MAMSRASGEALYAHRDALPTYRAHNEQAMAHAAIAYAKAHFRRRMMACTTSIGPGATNLVTAAALAHVNRLPVLLLPGDVFVSRAPDPVLQQVERFRRRHGHRQRLPAPGVALLRPHRASGAVARGVAAGSAGADRSGAVRPGDAGAAAGRADDGVRLSRSVLRSGDHRVCRAAAPTQHDVAAVAAVLRDCARPLLVAGGGVLYGKATEALREFAQRHGVPVAETQAGKGTLPWDHPLQLGAIGVTGSPAANALAADADVVLAVGTRLSDFTTGSHSLFAQARLVNVNVNAFDARKWRGIELLADAGAGLAAVSAAAPDWRAGQGWQERARRAANDWRADVARLTSPRTVALPYEGDVIGAVQRSAADSPSRDIVVCAAGTLPAELHKLWRTAVPGGYHMEYGYSCMGYEIAGGLGVKMARPDREVIVIVGDGSYLMLNSEIATSIMLGMKLVIVVLDNRGYGCINRLQQACGGEPFNNLLDDCVQAPPGAPRIDFAAHAASLGALSENVKTIPELEAALGRGRTADRTYVVCIETDPAHTTAEGGCWWEVAVPEVSERAAGALGACALRRRQAKADTMTSARSVERRNFDVKIGINPISWSNDDLPSLGGETPLEVALTEGRAIGYQGFELGNKFPRESGALRRVLAAHQLELVSGWYSGGSRAAASSRRSPPWDRI